MLRKLLRAKIHRATVTRCDPEYVGSITIDADLLREAGIRPNEAVWVLNLDNAVRIETYVIRGEPGSGAIEINGAAARLFEVGQRVIILTYGLMTDHAPSLDAHESVVVIASPENGVERVLRYPSHLDEPSVAHTP